MTNLVIIDSFDEGLHHIAERCKALAMLDRKTPIAIGVAGGSASGKTIFATKLVSHLSGPASLLSMDDYYHTRAYRREHDISGFDDPRAFKLSLFAEHLAALACGKTVYAPSYSFKASEVTEAMRCVESAPFIIADGLFVLLPELEFSFHLSIFLWAQRHEMLLRRIRRDIERTDQAPEDIARMFVEEVYPAYKRHVLPSALYADVVINNDWTPKQPRR